jgi:hypothetical protein
MSIEAPEIRVGLREKYINKVDGEGFVDVAALAVQELKRQNKSIAGFLDLDSEYFLGDGLRYKSDPGNYEASIHIDDLEEFVKRVKEHYGE